MLSLSNVLGWMSGDVNSLECWLKKAEKLDISVDDISDQIENNGCNKTDINSWFYVTIESIFYRFLNDFKKWTKKKYPLIYDGCGVEDLIYDFECDFNPYINYLDSWFNNELDNYDFENIETDFKSFLKYILNEN